MLSNLTMIVLVTAAALVVLSIIHFFLASLSDRAAAAAGPIEELAVYDTRIEAAKVRLLDIENDLEERRKALADIAGVQADVDALRRQKADLETEWAGCEERRKEVLAVRSDMEDAMIERQGLDAELIEKREEYLQVKERLERAERLVHQIDGLASEKAELDAKVEALREDMRNLQEAEKRVADLERRATELEAEGTRLDGRLASREADLAEVSQRLNSERALLADNAAELSQMQASRAAEELDLSKARIEAEEMSGRLGVLEGKLAGKEEALSQMQQRMAALGAELKRREDEFETRRQMLTDLQDELAEARADLASAENTVSERRKEMENLNGRRHQAEARLAQVDADIARRNGQGSGSADPTVDPLKELRQHPPVITQLQALPAPEHTTESESLHNVELRLRAFGLTYHQRVQRAFHTAMKINESSQMAVLAGISGTGKSQLPRQYAAAMGIGFLQVPVQPRWDSPQDLMGFYNYIEGKFRPTDMARALYALDQENNSDALEDRMMMVLLDEMNLARVEYYFSDFLSRLESRPARERTADKALRKDAEIELEIPKMEAPPRIFPGYNLLFAGTMNEDESTQSLSDKVVDRANILRFAAPKEIHRGDKRGTPPEVHALSQQKWQSWLRPADAVANDPAVNDRLSKMVDIMRDFKRPFGHRLGRAIMDYVANYPALDGVVRHHEPMADQIEMRLLPKLRGVEVEAMEPTFSELRRFVETDLGDTVLAEAIGASVAAAENTNQFVWNGVMR